MQEIISFKNAYLAIIILLAIQRIGEMFIARRNEKKLIESGAKVFGQSQLLQMKILHTCWIATCFFHVLFISPNRIPNSTLFIIFLIIFLFGQSLRLIAMLTLKNRWTTNIVYIPDSAPIRTGIYKYIGHPNYLGVILEFFSLPFMWGMWSQGIIFSLLNLIVLKIRVTEEEYVLRKYGKITTGTL